MVTDALREWTIFNVRTEEEGYMNEQKQKDAVHFIVNTVMERSTTAIIDQLSIGYPISDKTTYAKIITSRALMAVLNYSITQNSMNMEENLPNSLFNPNM